MSQEKKCINCNDFLNNSRVYDHTLFCCGECKDAYLRKIERENNQ